MFAWSLLKTKEAGDASSEGLDATVTATMGLLRWNGRLEVVLDALSVVLELVGVCSRGVVTARASLLEDTSSLEKFDWVWV